MSVADAIRATVNEHVRHAASARTGLARLGPVIVVPTPALRRPCTTGLVKTGLVTPCWASLVGGLHADAAHRCRARASCRERSRCSGATAGRRSADSRGGGPTPHGWGPPR